jgi:hypothetical protein
MADLDRVLRWFEEGALLRPDPLRPSTVSLSRALAAIGGAGDHLDEPARRICEAIGDVDHVVLVLADGLGLRLVESLPETSFLRRHLALEMRSVFPSSTAPALTSLATGTWPAEHGLLGWFAYLPELDIHAISLPFRQRFSGRPLTELGIRGSDVFAWPALLTGYVRHARLLMPRNIAHSIYTSAIAGGVPVDSYKGLDQAVMRLLTRLDGHREPKSYTYFYYPSIDTAAHAHGPTAPQVRAEVEVLDAALERLHAGLDGRARIIVSSDHGGIDVGVAEKRLLEPQEHLSALLKTPPTGEPRAPIFHVVPGAQAEFAELFRERFGEQFALLTAAEVFDLGLLGPPPLSEAGRSRLGDFMALSAGYDALIYATDVGMTQMVGFHGGLSPEEVRIPLIVA